MHVWTSQSLGPLHVSGKRKHSYAHPNPAMSFQQFEKHKTLERHEQTFERPPTNCPASDVHLPLHGLRHKLIMKKKKSLCYTHGCTRSSSQRKSSP